MFHFAQIIEVLIPISFFALIGVIVYYTTKFNYETKKSILENGGKIELSNQQTCKNKFPSIEIGLTIIGVAIGLGFSVIPKSMDLPQESKDLLTAASVLFFGGLGLISAFFTRKKLNEKN